MSYKITDSVTWLGKIDWELRSFHGEELSTHKGSSYNSYLVRDEKIAIIDSVYTPFAEEFIENLKKEIDPKTIDYVIVNHGEPDHSGALPLLMDAVGNEKPIYCTSSGMKSIKGYYHRDWDFRIVKTGDRLNLGTKEFTFVEAQMLHWPDSMAEFLDGENILFSNDMFGQHLASEFMTNDRVNREELYYEAMKYWACIVQPFSAKAVKKLQEIAAMNLNIEMICPSHGVIWRDNPSQIIDLYTAWANEYAENQVTIVYDTMYNSTRRMAESIAEGIVSVDPEMTVKLFNVARTDHSDLLTEIFRSKAVIAGSPAINGGILSHVSALIEDMKNSVFKNKRGGAFLSYGWSPAGLKQIADKLIDAGFPTIGNGVKVQWKPTAEGLRECFDYGKEFAEKLNSEMPAEAGSASKVDISKLPNN